MDLYVYAPMQKVANVGFFLMSFINQHKLTAGVCHLKDRIWSAHTYVS